MLWCKHRSLLFSFSSVLDDHETRSSPCFEKLHSLFLYRGTQERWSSGVWRLFVQIFLGKFLGPCFNGTSDIVSPPLAPQWMQNFFIKIRCLARRGEQEWLYLRLNSGFAQLSPWLNSAWITCQLFRAANFCWSLESQLGRHFTWIHSCFAEDKEEKYFLMRCYWSIVLLQKWNYHSDTNRPLLNVLENKGKPSGWKLGIFPLLSLIDPQWIYVYLIFFSGFSHVTYLVSFSLNCVRFYILAAKFAMILVCLMYASAFLT